MEEAEWNKKMGQKMKMQDEHKGEMRRTRK
jgi:hypothetical protein